MLCFHWREYFQKKWEKKEIIIYKSDTNVKINSLRIQTLFNEDTKSKTLIID